MSIPRFFLITGAVWFCLPIPLRAQTHVSGTVSGVWTAAGNPYIADSSIYVPYDSTLILMPGVDLQFSDIIPFLTVDGEIQALGLPGDSVTFRTLAGIIPHVQHLILTDFCSSNSIFQYCSFQLTMMEVHGTSVTIQHCGNDWEGSFYRSSTILQNCTVDQVQTDTSSSITVSDCQVGFIRSKESHDIFSGSTIGEIYCTYSWNIISDNTIWDGISIWDMGVVGPGGEYWLDNNYIFGTIESVWGANDTLHLSHNVIDVRGTEPEAVAIEGGQSVILQNNTILSDEIGIQFAENWSELVANSNIIIADTGVVFEGGSAWLGYNLFDCQVPAVGCSLQSMPGNLQEAALLEGGNPFDYHLQPLSPSIDAGSPLPQYLDPDSTRCDIGALFYDQRLDHAPTITSSFLVDTYPDSQFAYCASAVDDGDSLHFEFSGLPDWVQVPPVAYVSEELWLGGVVPSNQEVFGFTIYAYDEIQQVDSLQVQVRVIHHPLSGTLTGILPPVEPFYTVVDQLTVPSRDTLTILPGTELRFLRAQNVWARLEIEVEGTLLAEGNAQDSIIFASAELNPQDDDWAGIKLSVYWGNASHLRYCRFSDFDGFGAGKGSLVHCTFWGALSSMNCVLQYDTDSLLIDSCEIHNKYLGFNSGGHLQISNCMMVQAMVIHIIPGISRSQLTVRDNILSQFASPPPALWIRDCEELIVEGNRFSNGSVCIDVDQSYAEIRRNLFEQCGLGVGFTYCLDSPTGEHSLIAQCTINNSWGGLWVSGEDYGDTLIIENNLITNCPDYGINMGQFHPSELRYNDVWGNAVNYQNCTPGPHDLSVDPEYLGLAPYEYHLMPTSPCVDAGDPSAPLDPDSTRADIGAFFYDQRNTPPQIVGWSPEVLDTVEVSTSVQFSVEVVDFDLDTIYYDWTLNGMPMTTLPNFTHEFSQTGCDTITVRVTDGNGEDQHTWVVTTVLLGVEDRDNLLPVRFYLDPNYPNPFNASTRIRFGLPQDAWTTIRIFDIMGRQVATLWDGYKPAGHHSVNWNLTTITASGLYIICITAKDQGGVIFQEYRKSILLK